MKNISVKTIFLLLSLFLSSLFISYSLIDRNLIPVLFPDSESYLALAKNIQSLVFPDISHRTPIYPFFLAMFDNHYVLVIYFQLILTALSSVVSYIIINKIIKNRLLSFITALLIQTNFQIISFSATILTETLTIFLVLFFILTHIQKSEKITKKEMLLMILADILLVYTKPAFVALPLAVYICYAFIDFWYNKEFLKNNVIKYCIAFSIFILSIIMYSSSNLYQNGFFGLTDISEINTLGKMIQYGYLDKTYTDQPESVTEIIAIEKEEPEDLSPHKIINKLEARNSYSLKKIKETNSYFMKKNRISFIKKTIKQTIENFSARRVVYSHLSPNINRDQYKWLEAFWWLMNRLNIFGFIASFALFIVFLVSRNYKFINSLGLLLFVVLYGLLSISAFAYGEWARMRVPVEPIMILLIIIPISFLYNRLFIYFTKER